MREETVTHSHKPAHRSYYFTKAAYLLFFSSFHMNAHIKKKSRQTLTVSARTGSPFDSAQGFTAVETEEEATGSRLRTRDRFPRPHWSPSTWH